MITSINLGRNFLRFKNSLDRDIVIDTNLVKDQRYPFGNHKFYSYIKFISFLQNSDGIIVSFEPHPEATDEEIRRNIFKFDEDGKIVWIIEDYYKKAVLPSNMLDIVKDSYKKAWFNNLYYNNRFNFVNLPPNKIFADQTDGSYYSIDIATGEVEFLTAFKD